MNEQSAYILIALAVILGAFWWVRRMGRTPPPPTHLDDLNAELRQAQSDALAEVKLAEKSAAMATVYQQRVAWLKQEIENERARTVLHSRADVSPGLGAHIPAGVSRA